MVFFFVSAQYNKSVPFFVRLSMKNQIFRETILPSSLLFDMLEIVAMKTAKYYYIDYNSYKKFMYEEAMQQTFVQTIRPYYHESKQHYLDRKMTYNSFINIVRQICKNNNIPFTSKIRYNKSAYNIDYYIFYGGEDMPITPRIL